MSGHDQGAKVYWLLIRARLRDQACGTCGASLQGATVVSAGEGTTLEEYGLSETSAARLLAATEVLTVRCAGCGASSEIGRSLVHTPERAILSAEDMAQWSPQAVDVYRSIVSSRLADRLCPGCGSSLQAATVQRAAGGMTLPEFDLDDEAAVSIIAWTQRLLVECPQCRSRVEI